MAQEPGGSLASEIFEDLAVIIDAALDQEEEKGSGLGHAELEQLWRAIKDAVLEEDVGAEGEGLPAPSHAAAAALPIGAATAAAHAHPRNTWQCNIRIFGKEQQVQDKCINMTIKRGGGRRALVKCQALAKKATGGTGTVMKPPVRKPCS